MLVKFGSRFGEWLEFLYDGGGGGIVFDRFRENEEEGCGYRMLHQKSIHYTTSSRVDPPALEVITPLAEVIPPEHAESTGSPSSTTDDQDAPSPSKSKTTPKTQPLVIPHDVEEDNHDIEVAHMGNDPFFGMPIPKVASDQSSSTDSTHTTFLNGNLREKGYISQPNGFVDPDNPNYVYKLKKAFYGLKQAPRAWYDMLSLFLVSQDFSNGSVDLTLFIHINGKDLLLPVDLTYNLLYACVPDIKLDLQKSTYMRSKHIDIRYHFIKDHVENGVIEIYFVNTEYQLADIFTKALGRERIEFLINKLGMRSFTPETLKQLTDEVDE
nr:copia protein [Tanacetum cinerariifolium]